MLGLQISHHEFGGKRKYDRQRGLHLDRMDLDEVYLPKGSVYGVGPGEIIGAPILLREQDRTLGFVDAAVVAIVERLNEHKLATLDHRHFTTIRPKHTDAIELLPH